MERAAFYAPASESIAAGRAPAHSHPRQGTKRLRLADGEALHVIDANLAKRLKEAMGSQRIPQS